MPQFCVLYNKTNHKWLENMNFNGKSYSPVFTGVVREANRYSYSKAMELECKLRKLGYNVTIDFV